MTLHLLKLCVGARTVDDLAAFQKRQMKSYGRCVHTTRMFPRRADELCDGGSMYWIIAGQITVRQKIIDIERFVDDAGIGRCHLEFDPELVLTRLKAHRPFQGWRYYQADNAPADLAVGDAQMQNMPEDMRRELSDLGLI